VEVIDVREGSADVIHGIFIKHIDAESPAATSGCLKLTVPIPGSRNRHDTSAKADRSGVFTKDGASAIANRTAPGRRVSQLELTLDTV
ncbi:hypothetical protein PV327_011126, partial [Microctonus hyperodae]